MKQSIIAIALVLLLASSAGSWGVVGMSGGGGAATTCTAASPTLLTQDYPTTSEWNSSQGNCLGNIFVVPAGNGWCVTGVRIYAKGTAGDYLTGQIQTVTSAHPSGTVVTGCSAVTTSLTASFANVDATFPANVTLSPGTYAVVWKGTSVAFSFYWKYTADNEGSFYDLGGSCNSFTEDGTTNYVMGVLGVAL